jgi:hypothetical protein
MFEKMKFIMGQMWEFLAPFIRQMMTTAGPILADAAIRAVTSVEVSMQSAGGSEKRAAAFDAIKDDLAQKGLSLAASTINAAIEAAVVKLASK